jgi:hypothetical protein
MSAADELIEAIDELLAFVFRRRGLDRGDIPRSELAHFHKLDQKVFRLAKDLDLLDCLPKQDELARMHAEPKRRPLWFEGKTNLPGDWEDDIFMALGNPKWLRDMQALRSIAEARGQRDESEIQTRPDTKTAKKVKRKPSVNARMLETMQRNPESHGWSASRWAGHLKCAKSSIAGTPTWKDLALVRVRLNAEHAADRRRNGKTQRGNRTK